MIIHNPVITGSFQINGNNISSVESIDNVSSSVVLLNDASASFSTRVTAAESSVDSLNTASSSYLLNTTDTLDGDLTVTGKITAQEFHTEFVSASIIYQSGSTQFGNSADDTHIFTGNVGIGTADPKASFHTAGPIDGVPASDGVMLGVDNGYGAMHLNGNAGSYIDFSTGSMDRRGRIIYFNSSDQMRIQTNTNDRLTINHSGSIGIGTTEPDYTLDIVGSLRSSVNIVGTNMYATGNYVFGLSTTEGEYINRTGNDLIFYAGGASRFTIDGDNGRIGVGTTTPSEKLEVNVGNILVAGGGVINPQIKFADGGGVKHSIGLIDSGDKFTIGSNDFASKWVSIDTNGNVGIGADSPLRKLHVVGSLAVNAATTQYYGIQLNGEGEGANPSMTIGDWHNASATIKWDSSGRALVLDTQYSTGAGTFKITGNDEASTFVTVDSAGNVGIGTTATSNARLTVKRIGSGDGNAVYPSGSWGAQIFTTQDAEDHGGLVVGSRWANNNNIVFQAGNTYLGWNPFFTVKGGGRVGIGTVTPDTMLHISSNGTGQKLQLTSTNTTYVSDAGPEVHFKIVQSNLQEATAGFIRGFSANGWAGGLLFHTHNPGSPDDNTSERLRIDSDGLKFNGDTAAANALDDYEEGTWTPNGFNPRTGWSASGASASGKYTKIGNMVYCQVDIAWADGTATIVEGDRFSAENLPFASSGGTIVGVGNFWIYENFSSGINAYGVLGAINDTGFYGTVTYVQGSIQWDRTLRAEFTYRVS
jgi:hypothetical protein